LLKPSVDVSDIVNDALIQKEQLESYFDIVEEGNITHDQLEDRKVIIKPI